AAENEIVAGQVEGTNGKRIERQVFLEVSFPARKTLHPRDANVGTGERLADCRRIEQRCKDWRTRKKAMQHRYDAFCPTGLVQVVVNDRDFHASTPSITRVTFASIAWREKLARTCRAPASIMAVKRSGVVLSASIASRSA